MMKTLGIRTCIVLVVAWFSAMPVWAGRGIVIDSSIDAPICYFGATSCGFVDLTASGVYQRAYIYREGLVSIDALLPSTADANDPSTFGSGIWFAPGLTAGASYVLSAYRSSASGTRPVSWAFNFIRPENVTGSFLPEEFQVYLSSAVSVPPGPWNGVSAQFGYREPGRYFCCPATGQPDPGALIGFGWGEGSTQTVRFENGLLVGPRTEDTDFVSTKGIVAAGSPPTAPTRFTPLYATTGVPEPETWGLLVLGFGALGGALRRRLRTWPALA